MQKQKKMSVQTLALLALLTALVAILAYLGGFIKIGGFASISLTLIPVVLGAALCGPWAGAWLGFVAGAVFFATPDALYWISLSLPGTIITVLVKGALSGLVAGLVYKLIENKNKYLAVMSAAIVCPLVNTGTFILGCFIFFRDALVSGAAAEGISIAEFIIIFYVGLNFVFELISNIVLSPTIVKLLNIRKKKH